MHKTQQHFFIFLLSLLLSTTVWAKPKVELSMSSEKEITLKENGVDVVKRVPATEVEPGQILVFTLSYSNKGDEKATNVVFNNPIPKETVYEPGSAIGSGSEITFSIDGGKNYKKPSLLTYETRGPDGKPVKKKASPEQYTHVRWKISSVAPGGGGQLSYKARVK